MQRRITLNDNNCIKKKTIIFLENNFDDFYEISNFDQIFKIEFEEEEKIMIEFSKKNNVLFISNINFIEIIRFYEYCILNIVFYSFFFLEISLNNFTLFIHFLNDTNMTIIFFFFEKKGAFV